VIASFRRLTSLLAAFALVNATAAPRVAVCEDLHAAAVGVGSAQAMDVSEHATPAANGDSECPESESPSPCGQNHDPDCQTTCASMPGCSSHSFVVEPAQGSVIDHETPALAVMSQPHPSRTFAPDRPPPRV
jgi:hypothetical protein